MPYMPCRAAEGSGGGGAEWGEMAAEARIAWPASRVTRRMLAASGASAKHLRAESCISKDANK